MISCEIELILTWSKYCALVYMTVRDADPQANPAVTVRVAPTELEFQIADTKLYVPIVTLLK